MKITSYIYLRMFQQIQPPKFTFTIIIIQIYFIIDDLIFLWIIGIQIFTCVHLSGRRMWWISVVGNFFEVRVHDRYICQIQFFLPLKSNGRTCRPRSIRNRPWNRGVHVLEDPFFTRRKRWEWREEYFWCAAFTAPPTFRWIKDGTCPFYCLGWKHFARGRFILQLWWQCRSFSARRWCEIFNFNFFLDFPRIYFSSEIS